MSESFRGRVLVTGAAGYVGSVLCMHLLEHSWEVLGVDSFLWPEGPRAIQHLLGRPGFSFLRHDARDVPGMRPFLEKADAVIPLAALVGAPACEKNPDYARGINTEAIVSLAESLSPNQRLIWPNTNSGYGETSGEQEVTEDSPLNPISVYGRTKVEAEKVVLDHGRGTSLRLATVFGPSPRMRFDLMVNDFTRKLCLEGRLDVREGNFRRNFVHVRDVARGFAFMLEREFTGVYNFGSPESDFTKTGLARRIAEILELNPENSVLEVSGEPDPDRRNYRVSNARILGTGFGFRYSLEDGVMDTAGLLSLYSPEETGRMRNA